MSFLTYNTADDIITSLEIIEKLLFPETDFWHDNYLKWKKLFFWIYSQRIMLFSEWLYLVSTSIKPEYRTEEKSRIKIWTSIEPKKQRAAYLYESVYVCFRKRQFNSMVLVKKYFYFITSHAFMPECTGKGVLLSWGTILYWNTLRGAKHPNLNSTPSHIHKNHSECFYNAI